MDSGGKATQEHVAEGGSFRMPNLNFLAKVMNRSRINRPYNERMW
jgi:hypothetical protein